MNWTTAASLATAFGTLVLALATFYSTRSANRSTRLAEQALLAGIRPLLVSSRFDDPDEKVGWADEHWTKVPGGRGVFESDECNVYLAGSVRNVGTGLAVLHGWYVIVDLDLTQQPEPADPEQFHRLTRDLYIPPGHTGFWQGAIRDTEDADFKPMKSLLASPRRFAVDVMYGDQEGGQRTITRFGFLPSEHGWACSTARHWFLDRDNPR